MSESVNCNNWKREPTDIGVVLCLLSHVGSHLDLGDVLIEQVQQLRYVLEAPEVVVGGGVGVVWVAWLVSLARYYGFLKCAD